MASKEKDVDGEKAAAEGIKNAAQVKEGAEEKAAAAAGKTAAGETHAAAAAAAASQAGAPLPGGDGAVQGSQGQPAAATRKAKRQKKKKVGAGRLLGDFGDLSFSIPVAGKAA